MDFAAGMAVDMLWNDMSFREAAISNAAGMFVGGAVGVAAPLLAKAIVPSKWDNDLHVLPASPLLEGAALILRHAVVSAS